MSFVPPKEVPPRPLGIGQPAAGNAPANAGMDGRPPAASAAPQDSATRASTEAARDQPAGTDVRSSPPEGASKEVTVVVHGEAVAGQESKSSASGGQPKDKQQSAPKTVSEAKAADQHRLPSLADDPDVNTSKDHVVTRDGEADLSFTGTLLASAAPESAPGGKWQEYRVYETTGGKYVFSRVSRTVYAEDKDKYEAEIFDPSPESMPKRLLKSVRDVALEPLTWKDAAVDFFGYDPLAKALYRKLGHQFEEHIN